MLRSVIFLLFGLFIFFIQCQAPMSVNNPESAKFPPLKARTLAGNQIKFPEDIQGKPVFIAMVFENGGAYAKQQKEADAWAEFFEVNLKEEGIEFYEIPMMAQGYSLISWWVDGGMRSGIPEEKHDQVACYYGNKSKYLKALDLPGMEVAHVFLLDKKGTILSKGSGIPSPEKEKKILQALAEMKK